MERNYAFSPLPEKTAPAPDPFVSTDLHRRLTGIILQNPFWNDFHLLHCLQKAQPNLTMADLRRLKIECRLENPDLICGVLLRKLFADCGSGLNTRQREFLLKTYPELRDQDIHTDTPGKLLVYACLGGQRIRGVGRMYIHIFVDMFNGHIFGHLSQHSTVAAGLKALEAQLVPFYLASSHPLRRIVHSSPVSPNVYVLEEINASPTLTRLGAKWEHSTRLFGHIEHFQKVVLASDFYENARYSGSSFNELQYSFGQWLKKYNIGISLN